MRKVLMVLAAALFLATGAALAADVALGQAEPESDASAVGWDQHPAAGNWGGRGADGSFAVAWEHDSPDVPDNIGRFAEVTIPGRPGCLPTAVKIGWLAGVANDDFCVLVQAFKCSSPSSPKQYVAIGCFNEDEYSTTENWTENTFTLPPNVFHPGQDVTVQIRVTGNAWWGFGTWGQLGVDYVKVMARCGSGGC